MRMIDTLTVQHIPTAACARDHCAHHGVDEPAPPGRKPYLICPECFHLFATPRDLRRAHRANIWADLRQGHVAWRTNSDGFDTRVVWWRWLLLLARPARRIWFCPFCTHDF